MKTFNAAVLTLFCSVSFAQNDSVGKDEFSLENLMNMEIVSASNVVESKKTSPYAVYVVTEQDILLNNYTSLIDVLNSVPGVTAIDPSFFAVGGQRGFLGNFSQSLIMVNGREMQNLIAAETFISNQFSTHNIKKVEVLQGPGSSVYGANAFVGVINIITKNQQKDFEGVEVEMVQQTQGTTSYAVFFREQLNELEINGSFKTFQTNNWDYTNFIKDSVNFSEGFSPIARNIADENDYHSYSKANTYDLEAHFKGFYAGVIGYFLQNGKGLENVSLNFHNQRDFRKFNTQYFGYKHSFSKNNHIKAEFQLFNEKAWGYNYSFDQDIYDGLLAAGKDSSALLTPSEITDEFLLVYSQENSSGSKRQKGTIQWENVVKEKIHINLGYVFDRYDLLAFMVSRDNLYPHFDETISDSNNLRKPFFIMSKNAFFLHLKSSFLNDKLFVTLGARGDYHSIYGFVPTLRSGAVYSPNDKTFVKASFGQAFREPTIFELGGGKGGSLVTLHPATINTYELNYTQHFSKNIMLQLSMFRNDATNFIKPSTTDAFENSHDVFTSQGVEFLAQYKVSKFRGDVWYAYTQNSGDSIGGELVKNLNIYPHRVGGSINYNLYKFLHFNLRANYYGAVAAAHGNSSIDQTISLEDAVKLDVALVANKIKYENGYINLSFGVNNVFNEQFYQPNVRRSGPKQLVHPGRVIQFKIEIGI